MKTLVLTYQELSISANREAWFNATQIAAQFGKRLDKFWERQETQDYLAALHELSNTPKTGDLKFNIRNYPQFIRAQKGNNGGTWLHPDLMVLFARWIDVRFSIWCDQQIKALLTDAPKWNESRSALSLCTRLQNEALKTTLEAQGKAPQHYHYINEARLLNRAFSGQNAINRDQLSSEELKHLIHITAHNLSNIYQGKSYQERKQSLNQALVE